METIKNYLDNIFAAVPDTYETARAKAEMLANMEERYAELKARGKSENEAIGSVIAEFGSAEELFSEMGFTQNFSRNENGHSPSSAAGPFAESPLPLLGTPEADEYIASTERASLRIAIGVALIQLGVGVMLGIFGAFGSGSASGQNGLIGVLALFLFLIVGIVLTVFGGASLAPYEYIAKQDFMLTPGARTFAYARAAAESKAFPKRIAMGVAAIFMGIVAMLLIFVAAASLDAFSGNPLFGVSAMMAFLAAGVFMLVRAGMRHDAYDRLLSRGEYSPKNAAAAKTEGLIASVYWPAVVIAYLVTGFTLHLWHINWVIWPIAGVAFGAVSNLLKARRA